MGKKRVVIPVLLLFGLLVLSVMYFVYGWLLALRYLLGGLLFATLTVFLIQFLQKHYGKKKLRLF